jgi:iron complex transport system substrate-binding protein
MTGLPWKDAWYVPGGKSFAAAFIRDAGGDYLWKDMESHEAAPLSLESVFERGSSSGFWINCGNALSLEDIRQTEARLAKIAPFRNGNVYNNTGRINSSGGNDFWETGVMEPHLILADLIRIFHPELLPGHELKYYRQLH